MTICIYMGVHVKLCVNSSQVEPGLFGQGQLMIKITIYRQTSVKRLSKDSSVGVNVSNVGRRTRPVALLSAATRLWLRATDTVTG